MPDPVQLLLSIETIGDRSCLDLEEGLKVLSIPERERASAFRFQVHRDRYIRGRALLRWKIADLLNTEAHRLEFQTESRGKPYLKERELSFNLSHSGDTAVFAFSREPVDLGVDIEELDRRGGFEDISAHFFTPGEQEVLAHYSGEEWRRQFLRIWTAKEARMKIFGEGLALDPRKIDLFFTNGLPSGYRCPQPTNLYLEIKESSIFRAVVSVTASVPFTISGDGLS